MLASNASENAGIDLVLRSYCLPEKKGPKQTITY